MKFTVLLVSTMLLVSCSTTTNRSQKSGALDVKVKSDLQADVEVDMSKKIQGTAKHVKLFGIFDIQSSKNYVDGVVYDSGSEGFALFKDTTVEDAKSAAAYNAVVPNKADVLVAPQYLIQVKSYVFGMWKEVTAQVSGYAGRVATIKTNNRPSPATQLAVK